MKKKYFIPTDTEDSFKTVDKAMVGISSVSLKNFIIDFDSSFISVEALDELARISLADNPKKKQILQKIKKITNQGMEGKLPFNDSLAKRIKLFSAKKTHIEQLIKFLKRKITSSVSRNKIFFKKYADQIYIISGGFKEYIVPIMKPFGIAEDHILANTFVLNKKGVIIGYDKKNPLSKEKGKVKAVKKLNLKGKVYVIGDGYTDYQIKESAQADKFFAFVENVVRSDLLGKADVALPDFDELLYRFHLPRAFSYPKSRIKVLLLENIHSVAKELLKKEGYQVETLNHALGEEELERVIKNISILGIRSKTKITEKVLEKAERLLVVNTFCIGTNQIDLLACSYNGTAVFNAPYSNTLEAQENIGQFAVSKIIEFINTGNTMMSVNLPNLQLPKLKKGHRFIHLHKNMPGILVQINSLLDKYKINIENQYLKTNESVGYVITDVNKKYGKGVIKALKNIPETLRFRTLY